MSGRLVVSVDDTDKGTKGFKDKTSSLLTRGPGSLRSKGVPWS